jgi:hypothetical protein
VLARSAEKNALVVAPHIYGRIERRIAMPKLKVYGA